MSLSKIAIALTCILAFSACTPETGSPDQASQAVASAAEPAAPVERPCVKAAGYEILPGDLCVHEQYRMLDQRMYQDPNGNERRRVSFELPENDAEKLIASISGVMSAAGYRESPRTVKPNGRISVPFAKRDLGTTYLEVNPGTPSDAAEPVVGSFFIDSRVSASADAN